MSTNFNKNSLLKQDSKAINKNIEVAVRMRPLLDEFEDLEAW